MIYLIYSKYYAIVVHTEPVERFFKLFREEFSTATEQSLYLYHKFSILT